MARRDLNEKQWSLVLAYARTVTTATLMAGGHLGCPYRLLSNIASGYGPEATKKRGMVCEEILQNTLKYCVDYVKPKKGK